MILLYFLELYILNKQNYYIETINNNNFFNINIRKLIISFGFAIIIYLMLHLVNQNSNKYNFETYNKILIILMLIDIIISLFFISKLIINDMISLTN
jgi:hypothetical protein